MKKRIMALLCSVALVGTVACAVGCASDEAREGDLIIWAGGQWLGEDAQNMEEFFDYVNDNYGDELGFKVKAEFKPSLEIDLNTSMTSNDQPDLLVWDRYQTASMAHDDKFISLDDLVERDNLDLSGFNQEAIAEMTYDGKLYGLPFDLDVWGLFINTDKVDAYNDAHPDDPIEYAPETWSDLLDMAGKLSARDGSGNISCVGLSATEVGQRYATFLASAGTSQIGDDGMANFDTPAFNGYLNFTRDLRELGIDRSGYNDQNAFMNGNLAIIFGSGYRGNYFKTNFPSGNYIYAPFPKFDIDGVVQEGAQFGGLLGGFGFAIPKPVEESWRNDAWNERVDMAWEFAKLVATNTELNQKWAEICGSLPANRATWDSDVIQNSQILKAIASCADTSQARPALYYFPLLDQQTIVKNTQMFASIGGRYNNRTNEEMIEIITTETNELINTLK